jgi:uncharacterized membrane protein YkvA (DUF1232 family)
MKHLCILLIAILYFLSPYDLVPDFVFGPGWLDDLALLGILVYYYYYRPKKQEQRRAAQGFRREDSQGKREGAPFSSRTPYEVLGLNQDATAEEVKRAYRNLAGQYHPDKVSHLGEEFRALAERKFKEIQRAYDELRPK